MRERAAAAAPEPPARALAKRGGAEGRERARVEPRGPRPTGSPVTSDGGSSQGAPGRRCAAWERASGRARRRSRLRAVAAAEERVSERRYRFGPLEQRAVVGPLRIGQLLIVAAAALLGLGSLYALRSFWSLLVGLGGDLRGGGDDLRADRGPHGR